MPVTLQDRPVTEGHTRYVLITGDAPGLVTIDGLVDYVIDHDSESGEHAADGDQLLGVMVITPDRESEVVVIDRNDKGTWVVTIGDADGDVVESIKYNPGNSDDVLHHQVWVNTFDSDAVPVFMVGLGP